MILIKKYQLELLETFLKKFKSKVGLVVSKNFSKSFYMGA